MRIRTTIAQQPTAMAKLVFSDEDDVPELVISEDLLGDDIVLDRIFLNVNSRIPKNDHK